jgi:hypothetical protein
VSANIDTSEENNESHRGIIKKSLKAAVKIRDGLLAC